MILIKQQCHADVRVVQEDTVAKTNSNVDSLMKLAGGRYPHVPSNIIKTTVLLEELSNILTNREGIPDSKKKLELENFLKTDFQERGLALLARLEDTYNQRNQSLAAMGSPSGFLENYAEQYNKFKTPFQKFLNILNSSSNSNNSKDSLKVENVLEAIYSSQNIHEAKVKLRNFIINTLSEKGFQGFSFTSSGRLEKQDPQKQDKKILEAFQPKQGSHPNSTNLSQAFETTVDEIFQKPLVKPSEFSRFEQAYKSCEEAIFTALQT